MSLRNMLDPELDYDVSECHILVDFDRTLATYSDWQGREYTGDPITLMVHRVRSWLAQGIRVKIFTARVAWDDKDIVNQQTAVIQDWCVKHIGQKLEVTCVKNCYAMEIWDDRAVPVTPNTGVAPYIPPHCMEYHGTQKADPVRDTVGDAPGVVR